MKTRKIVSILIIVVVAILMLTTVVASVEPVSAASKVKVKWDANGGKIGTAKTTITNVKKGVKIGKLPKTPKRSGYTFVGWYTKKSGGTKITATTKVKKKVTYYAQWKKASSRVLNAEEKKLIGSWGENRGWLLIEQGKYITFKSDGTFVSVWTKSIYVGSFQISIGKITQKGNFKVNNGKITTTNVKESFKKIRSGYGEDYNNKAVKLLEMPYKFLDNNGLQIDNLRYSGDEAYYFQKY